MATLNIKLRRPDGESQLPADLTVKIGTSDGTALDQATHAILGGPLPIKHGTETIDLVDLTSDEIQPAGAVYWITAFWAGDLAGRLWLWDGHEDAFLDELATVPGELLPGPIVVAGGDPYDDTELRDEVAQAAADTLAAAQQYTDEHVPDVPAASTSTPGLAERATLNEATAGADDVRFVTPAQVKAVVDAMRSVLLGGADPAWDTLQELKAGFDAGDAADQAAITALLTAIGNKLGIDQRETAGGVAGLTMAGKLYEARIPDRLSTSELAATFGPAAAQMLKAFTTPRSDGRAARWVARLSDRTKPMFSDSFDRPDAASALSTSDSGHAWTPVSGTWGIANHRAVLKASSEGCATVNLGVPADFIEGDLVNAPSGTPDPGLLIRCVDANNFLLVAHETTNKLNIWKKVGGTYTTIATVNTHSSLYAFGQNPFLRAEYQRGTGRVTAVVAGANGLRFTVTSPSSALNQTERNLFELDTHVGLRSGTSDFGSGYTNLIAGVK